MNHLIIHANHRDESFLSNAVSVLEQQLVDNGEQVNIRDLYKMEFNPVLTSSDIKQFRNGNFPEDILAEHKYIEWANYIWMLYPVWWSGMPAILKGYIDRVFSSGFAYKIENNQAIGLLNSKKAIIINSMGQSKEEYSKSGMFDAMNKTTDLGVFTFCGIEVLDHLFFTSITSASNVIKEEYYEKIRLLTHKVNKNIIKKEVSCMAGLENPVRLN
ncbi:MAG: NAD(P)H-dependent oxidoreductase [Bacteroidales bacterium]|nr:NAD(P)H-dependent oxidoreductase [Bacteroidales bacterium]